MALDGATNFAESTLAAGISETDTSLTVQSGHGGYFPDPETDGPFMAILSDPSYGSVADAWKDGAVEIVRVTGRQGDTCTAVYRAQEGTTGLTWLQGAKVTHDMTAHLIRQIDAAIRDAAGMNHIERMLLNDMVVEIAILDFHNSLDEIAYDTGFFDIFRDTTKILSSTDVDILTLDNADPDGKVHLQSGKGSGSFQSAFKDLSEDDEFFSAPANTVLSHDVDLPTDATMGYVIEDILGNTVTVAQDQVDLEVDLADLQVQVVRVTANLTDGGSGGPTLRSYVVHLAEGFQDSVNLFDYFQDATRIAAQEKVVVNTIDGGDPEGAVELGTGETAGDITSTPYDIRTVLLSGLPGTLTLHQKANVPGDENITYTVDDYFGHSVTVTQADIGTLQTVGTFIIPEFRVRADLSSTDGADTPTLEAYVLDLTERDATVPQFWEILKDTSQIASQTNVGVTPIGNGHADGQVQLAESNWTVSPNVDDFEDGDITGWTEAEAGTDLFYFTADSGVAINGTYSGRWEASSGLYAAESPSVGGLTKNIYFSIRADTDVGHSSDSHGVRIEDDTGAYIGYLRWTHNGGNIAWYDGSAYQEVNPSWSPDTNYQIAVLPDYGAGTVEILIDGVSKGSYSMWNAVTNADHVNFRVYNANSGVNVNVWIDDVHIGDYAPGTALSEFISPGSLQSTPIELAAAPSSVILHQHATLPANTDIEYEVHDGVPNAANIDDFEDGDLAGWTGDTAELSIDTSTVLSGGYSGRLTNTDSKSVSSPETEGIADDAHCMVRIGGNSGTDGNQVILAFYGTDGILGQVKFEDYLSKITIYTHDGEHDTGLTWSVDTTYQVTLQIDYTNKQWELFVNGTSGGTWGFQNSAGTNVNSVDIYNQSWGATRTCWFDDLHVGPVLPDPETWTGNTVTITQAQIGTRVDTSVLTGSTLRILSTLSSSDGVDTPTLYAYALEVTG